MKNEIIFSVIIVSYHCRECLENCLESIRQYNDIGTGLEIIVVDNSTDDSVYKWLKEQAADVTVIKNENKGFGEANNVGAKAAAGRYLLFLNPDTLLIEPVFLFAINVFKTDKKTGCFGLQLVDEKGRRTNSYGLRMPMGFRRAVFCSILIRAGIFLPDMMYVSGADMFISKEAFTMAGTFDESIFLYCEEADLCNRVNHAGYRISYYPQKKIIHLEGKTQTRRLSEKYQLEMRSREYYCNKYGYNFKRLAKKERQYCMFKSMFFYIGRKKLRAAEYLKIIKFWNKKISSLEAQPVNRKEEQTLC